jgi:heat shock protein HslJ
MLIMVACNPAAQPATPTIGPAGDETGAVTPQPPTPGAENNLANTQWTLVSFGPPGQETPVATGSTVTLEFDAAGQAGGTGGCNSFGSEYTVQDNTLSFGDIVSTLIACEDESIMAQEQQYYEALRSAGRFEVAADRLTIWYGGEAGTLNFVPLTPSAEPTAPPVAGNSLANTQWMLDSFGPAGSEMPVATGSTVTLGFDAAGQASGSGGCNSYGSEYTVQDSAISFGPIVSTQRACLDENVTQQEQAYFQALQSADQFELAADSLTIS